MEHKLPVLLCLVVLLLVCAGSGHGLRVLHDVDAEYSREFTFGSKAAVGAETAPRDPSFDDYENEISRVEFEPELGASYAAAPAPGPVTARSAATATGSSSMKWWLPPSTMPSFPLFPNPGGMPGMPGMPMPGGIPGIPGMPLPGAGGMPAMPFKPIEWGAAPAPPGQAQPTPPAAAAAEANDNPNPNEIIIN